MNDTSASKPRTGVYSDAAIAPTTPAAPMAAAPKAEEKRVQPAPSRHEKYAATQAGGDGIEGEVLKSGKSPAEKIGATMPDRK